jgi:hypothetical protein
MAKKKTTKPVIDNAAPSCVPAFVVPREQALSEFLSKVRDDGSLKPHVERFVDLCKFVESSFASFDFRTFVIHSRMLDISSELLRELFDEYAETMCRLRRWQEIQGCDGTIWILC